MSVVELSLEELARLRDAIEETGSPLSEAALLAAGYTRLARHAAPFEGMDAAVVLGVVDALIAARRARPPAPELVWTGPEATSASARDTEVVVRRLFSAARQEVIVAGYSFDHGADILRPLHEAMRDQGLRALLFLDIAGRARVPSETEHYATLKVREFIAHNWPFGDPRPDIYYDPRTVAPDQYASLHAKCIVVDRAHALVTSANFTNRGQDRNIETGVLLHDPGFAGELADQWWGLIRAGLVARFGG